jgi:hypothetical protein
MTPGTHPARVRRRLRIKLSMRPVMRTAIGGKATQKK